MLETTATVQAILQTSAQVQTMLLSLAAQARAEAWHALWTQTPLWARLLASRRVRARWSRTTRPLLEEVVAWLLVARSLQSASNVCLTMKLDRVYARPQDVGASVREAQHTGQFSIAT